MSDVHAALVDNDLELRNPYFKFSFLLVSNLLDARLSDKLFVLLNPDTVFLRFGSDCFKGEVDFYFGCSSRMRSRWRRPFTREGES